MPKVTIYTADILNDLPLKEVERLVNQQAERFNKQITRAKQQGLNTSKYFTNLDRAKVHRNGKPPAMKSEVYKRSLIKQYKQTETRLKGGVTKSNIARLSKKKEKYMKEYGLDQMSTEQFEQAYEIEEASKNKAELYYAHLMEGVRQGVITDAERKDRTKTTDEMMQTIEDRLAEISKTREPSGSMYSDENFWASRVKAYKKERLGGKYILK